METNSNTFGDRVITGKFKTRMVLFVLIMHGIRHEVEECDVGESRRWIYETH